MESPACLVLGTTKMHTEELTGNALIWAVCRALGHAPVVAATGVAYRSEHGSWVYPRYTDDSEAGVLIASELIGVERPSKGQNPPRWLAMTDNMAVPDPRQFNLVVSASGVSLGQAVCRALVLSRLGEFVDVPDTLRAPLVLYVYSCAACGNHGEVRLEGDDHDEETVACSSCAAAVTLEWDGGVTLHVEPNRASRNRG